MIRLLMTAMACSLSALAFSASVEHITFDGTRLADSLVLNSIKTHTEYRTETYPSTCYRYEFVGYRTYCYNVVRERCTTSAPVCHQVCTNGNCHQECTPGQTVCTPYTIRECRQEPVYENVPYTCYQTRQVPYEVTDYPVKANVELQYQALPGVNVSSDEIVATLSGDQLSISVKGQGDLVFFKAQEQVSAQMVNGEKVIQARYLLQYGNKSELLSAVSFIRDADLDEDNMILRYTIGRVNIPEALILSLRVKHNRFLGIGRKEVFDGILNSSQFRLTPMDNGTLVEVDLKSLGIDELKHRKYHFDITTEMKFSIPILTSGLQVPRAQTRYSEKP